MGQPMRVHCSSGRGSVIDTTFSRILEERAAGTPLQIAFRFLGRSGERTDEVAYGDLHRRACGIASVLRTRGDAGDRVVLALPSSIDYIAALFGCFYARMIAVPVFPAKAGRANERFQ